MLASTAVQTACTDSEMTPITNNFYATRRDVLALRREIDEKVPDKEHYGKILALYLHGMCSKEMFDDMASKQLITDELKLLHNNLLRAIVFNAHFSQLPPPNVTLRPHESTLTNRIQSTREIASQYIESPGVEIFTAAYLRRMLKSTEIEKRMRDILGPKWKIDRNLPEYMRRALMCYVRTKLNRAHSLSCRNDRVRITVGHIFESNAESISPVLVSKYSY